MQQDLKNSESIIGTLYNDRSNYTIIALTGYAGAGCSKLTEIMSKPFKDWKITPPDSLTNDFQGKTDNEDIFFENSNNSFAISKEIFQRKYSICYKYLTENYKPYRIIKYSKVLLYYSLIYICHLSKDPATNASELKEKIKKLISLHYYPSHDDNSKINKEVTATFDQKIKDKTFALSDFNFDEWEDLYNLSKKAGKEYSEGDNNNILAGIFLLNTSLNKFLEALSRYLWTNHPYANSFFFHRLGYVLRAYGDPFYNPANLVNSQELISGDCLFIIVKLINRLIKGLRQINPELLDQKETKITLAEIGNTYEKENHTVQIVIDKIRNSLEAKYLKERYSAFYMISIHTDGSNRFELRERIRQTFPENNLEASAEIERQLHQIQKLDSTENSSGDFDKGRFFAPNTSQCVADAEIHICNTLHQDGQENYFYTMEQQWMKFASLILHPGLITPSAEERCMVVAYTAKYNSGCLSRQVGATITNKFHAIRSIGWNDVPYGQIPCALRSISELVNLDHNLRGNLRYVYSDYEKGVDKDNIKSQDFRDFIKHDKYKSYLTSRVTNPLLRNVPDSYCFKSLQNEFEKEKNQVHTRSLHAEENAILQMAKYGGEPLKEGIIYVTASPCELCCKKLYQIGVRKIIFIDEYPGISRENIIAIGFRRPNLKQYQGCYGATYFKLFQPFISYKDELSIRNPLSDEEKIIAAEQQIKKLEEEKLKLEKELKKLKEKFSYSISTVEINKLSRSLSRNKRRKKRRDKDGYISK